MIDQAAETLRQAGIINPQRVVNLIQNAIAALELDLSGMVVLTEAASGPYVVTPIIAALAGAETVFALTRDSQYASAEAVIAQTRALGVLCRIPEGKIEICRERSPHLFAQADIVTNLGFVRPLDAETVATMKPTAVVPLMCEAWEFRSSDIDLDACRRRGVIVLATNEEHPKVDVFDYCGWLALKMLCDAQIEIHKSRIVIVSSDKFGLTIQHRLESCGARPVLVTELSSAGHRDELAKCDVIVIADYSRDDAIIGPDGDIQTSELARRAPAATVLQYAGRIDAGGLLASGMAVYPRTEIGAHRMALTLAGLGPRPVIELHAAGLKVGQALIDARDRKQLSLPDAIKYTLQHSPAQEITYQGTGD